MNEQERTKTFTVGNLLTRLFQGAVLGLASCIPFFQVKSLKETMGFQEDSFSESTTLIQKLLWLLKNRWAYLIGIISGFVIFYFIPVESEISKFPMALVGGVLALCVGFLLSEIQCYSQEPKDKKQNIASLLTFVVVFLAFFFCYYILKDRTIEDWTQPFSLFFIFILTCVGSFITCYCGMSLGSVMFLTGAFASAATAFNSDLYTQTVSGTLLFVFAIVGLLFGYVLSVIMNHLIPGLTQEKHAANAAILVCGIVVTLAFLLKEPYYGMEFNTITQIAQIITIFATSIACFMVSIGLTLHNYKFLNKEENAKEEEEKK